MASSVSAIGAQLFAWVLVALGIWPGILLFRADLSRPLVLGIWVPVLFATNICAHVVVDERSIAGGLRRMPNVIQTLYQRARMRGLTLIGWPFVRRIGSLSLLVRASFGTLVVVPLLYAVWVVGQHMPDATTVSFVRQTLSFRIELTQSGPTHQSELFFSPTLVRLFFAAAAIAVGHFLFEVFCPREVVEFNERTFCDDRVRQFRAAPLPRKQEHYRSIMTKAGLGGSFVELRENLRLPAGTALSDFAEAPENEETLSDTHLHVVERAAAQEFLELSRARLPASLITTCLYVGAVWQILAVLILQLRTLYEASGMTPSDFFGL